MKSRNIKDGRFGWFEYWALKKIEDNVENLKKQNSCKSIYWGICSASAKYGEAEINVSISVISKFASLSRRTVFRNLPILKELKIIEYVNQGRDRRGHFKKPKIRLVSNNSTVCHSNKMWKDCGKDVDISPCAIQDTKKQKNEPSLFSIFKGDELQHKNKLSTVCHSKKPGDSKATSMALNIKKEINNTKKKKNIKKKKKFEFPDKWKNHEKFKKAWEMFEAHRNEIKKPLTDQARQIAFNKMKDEHPRIAVMMIEKCIERRWQTVFSLHKDEVPYIPGYVLDSWVGVGKDIFGKKSGSRITKETIKKTASKLNDLEQKRLLNAIELEKAELAKKKSM